MHAIESPKLVADVKTKTAILGTKSGKIVIVLDCTNGRIISYHTQVEFARETVV